jgi:23S rRNA (adenine2503-C2)-methyltransferase
MRIIGKTGCDVIATVYLAQVGENQHVEFVESLQPPIPREKKWVLIVSSLFGCPVRCPICDAGGYYNGKVSREDILAQIDFLVTHRYPDRHIPANKFKIQFARMGDPAFNLAVIDVLNELPKIYNAPGLMPCISTVAPAATDDFFESLLDVKRKLYNSKFQLQFSVHSTDPDMRDFLIPIKKWNLGQIAEYGNRFYENGDRKVTLNFAPSRNYCIEPEILKKYFDPDKFLIKITPLNPTYRAAHSNLTSYIDPHKPVQKYDLVNRLRKAGYEVLLSIGEVTENSIGSNCGQFILRHMQESVVLNEGYERSFSTLPGIVPADG